MAQGIKHYVFVTTVAFERMLRRMGVNCERFSGPRQIGIEKSVALWMHIDEQTINATCAEISKDLFTLPKGLRPDVTKFGIISTLAERS
jgi:N-acyl-L-homoserine lactone synthetase